MGKRGTMPESTGTNWTKNEEGEWVEAAPLMTKEDWTEIFAQMDADRFDEWLNE
jgi:hypothetical protein